MRGVGVVDDGCHGWVSSLPWWWCSTPLPCWGCCWMHGVAVDVGPTCCLAHGGHSWHVVVVMNGSDGLNGWSWWEEIVLSLCLVMCMKVIVKQTMAKQTVIKQTTGFWLHSVLTNLGTIPVSILECPNSTRMRMHQNEKISRPSCQILLHWIPPDSARMTRIQQE